MTDTPRLDQVLAFLAVADQLKMVERAAYLADGRRRENAAEHSWHTTLFALLLHHQLTLVVDIDQVLTLLIVHDLVEIRAGDTFAYDHIGRAEKARRETEAATELFAFVPDDLARQLTAWWAEFEAGATLEAQYARSIDRLQALAQNVAAGGRLWHERGVTEAMSRRYNQAAMALDPVLAAAFEALYRRAASDRLWPG